MESRRNQPPARLSFIRWIGPPDSDTIPMELEFW